MMIPVQWCFRRKELIPILEVKGETTVNAAENILIQHSIDIIEKAEQFKGRPCTDMPNFPSTSSLSVSFSIIFPSTTDADKFMESMQPRK